MKYRTWTKRITALLLTLLCLCLLGFSAVAATTDRVYDPDGLLSPSEADGLTARLNDLASHHGVELYLATYVADDRYDDFYGDDYCHRVKDLRGEDAVLLVVTYERANRMYYYNMYTYGKANSAINQKEVDYILDSASVYNNLKSGNLADGAASFFDQSAEAFTGRVGVSWSIVIAVSAIIALLISLAICAGVVANYKRKRATVDYPLDRYAKLELTRESDNFVREHVTRTYSPRSGNSGGGSSGGRHGGGGGHRGGR